ncbi:MAG: bifunctional hydroxymethylpyrimidine kinase/phosphomethylpyrimidine kinase [Proteobacteria bacterium]|nr:bifunctional hydroxymethylpyrimidine kinase/phosphomethylpyrimidine kinase [Pseudomonadota bacterium]MDA1355382.1 bifunctional hydroxymethylpyrimidine kinase/phosphomethylpyrimidine kinase [Pseudomonadota bacterium]
MKGRVLIVAGSDSGGGAGIQADVKTVTALGGYCGTAITVLTAQDTMTVARIEPVSADMVARQMHMMLDDIGVDCIKTGMLYSHDIIEAVAEVIATKARDIPLVVDPVLVAKSGDRLLEENALQAFKARLIPRASVITPNIPEAEVLTGIAVKTRDDMMRAAEMMYSQGVPAVLLKGGHMTGNRLTDLLQTEDGTELFEAERIQSKHTHGTGCTLASAIATGIAQGMELRDAVRRAREYVRRAIIAAPGFGGGHGPLDHTVTVRPLDDY